MAPLKLAVTWNQTFFPSLHKSSLQSASDVFKDGNAERCFCSFRRVNFWYSDITFGVIDTGKPHANRERLDYCRLRWNQHSEQPNTPAMDQYCFLLTGSDWSQTDMRFQDENSRCLLWRRMSSNRAAHPLMKPTGRQRHRNQRLHSPTHLTWLERLNWRARDCGCSSSCRCWCLRSLLHWSPAVLKWFSVEFFFPALFQLQRDIYPDQRENEAPFSNYVADKMSH